MRRTNPTERWVLGLAFTVIFGALGHAYLVLEDLEKKDQQIEVNQDWLMKAATDNQEMLRRLLETARSNKVP